MNIILNYKMQLQSFVYFRTNERHEYVLMPHCVKWYQLYDKRHPRFKLVLSRYYKFSYKKWFFTVFKNKTEFYAVSK